MTRSTYLELAALGCLGLFLWFLWPPLVALVAAVGLFLLARGISNGTN